MKKKQYEAQSASDLIDLFISTSIDQYKAEIVDDHRRWTVLYRKIESIVAELKSRPGDQRDRLVQLYDHKNMQVHVNAALATLAVSPTAARAELQRIAGWPHSAQRVQALDMLEALAKGRYVPS